MNKLWRRLPFLASLLLLSMLILSGTVFASPDFYYSRPTSYFVSGLTVLFPSRPFDNDNTTSATTSYASGQNYGGPGYYEVKDFDGSLPYGSSISDVKIEILYKTTLSSSDAKYEIAYSIDSGSTWTTIRGPVREMVDFSTTPLEYTAANILSWNDVSKVQVRFTTYDPRRSDTGGMLYIYEIWMLVTYTPVELYVDPPSQTVTTSFTANVNVTGVDSLYAWEFKLYYNTTILTATGATEGNFFTAAGKTTYFTVIELNDTYNPTLELGRVWATCTILGNVSGVSGAGILATISFDLDGTGGTSPLDLQATKLVGYTPGGALSSIPHTSFDGQATVPGIPEFPLGFALEIALIPLTAYGLLKAQRKTKHYR